MDEQLLKREEKAVFDLRSLYKRYGYLPFKMSKFEEYDFYARHKDFLVSDRVITFTDTGGKLLALKPDVTLSIVKSGKDQKGCKQKVCYNENVYRVSPRTNQYKEILQTGLECIGQLDDYDLYEVVSLAAQSLSLISDCFFLEVSHLGIVKAVLEEIGLGEEFRREAIRCMAGKNLHDLSALCMQSGADRELSEKLCTLAGLHGEQTSVLAQLSRLCTTEEEKRAYQGLASLSALLRSTAYADRILFDGSLVNDMTYYNGIVFKGYLNGVSESVLCGGQYDTLVHRLGRRAGAIGFALYLDLLEELQDRGETYDVDVLLLYTAGTDPQSIAAHVEGLLACGKSVSVQKAIPPKLRYRELLTVKSEK